MISILEEKRNTLILLSKMLLSVIRKKGNRKVLVYLFIVYHVSLLLLLCNVVMLCTIALNFSCLCTLNYYLTAKSLGYNKNNCKFA